MRKIIVAVAPVASSPLKETKNPLTPEEVAREVIGCTKAGASLVHLHVRNKAGEQTADLTDFKTTLDLIRKESDIIIQGSTGGVSNLSLEERSVAVDEPRVESASLNMGSANFDEGVYINTLPDIRYWARKMEKNNVQPELEIFEGGMIHNTMLLAEEGVLKPPFHFSFSLGFRGALPANAYNLHFLSGMIPPGSAWGLVHHGMKDFSMLATAVGMGATFVRVGFEDSIYYAPGAVARSNVELGNRPGEKVPVPDRSLLCPGHRGDPPETLFNQGRSLSGRRRAGAGVNHRRFVCGADHKAACGVKRSARHPLGRMAGRRGQG
ncbi:MAG TPA: 3-keto-5-aminohexanoate cleavage protein [Firmicutes bacterium]|nr:3-keto-5-aminohexanoate cleavage protein [Bacillota bacterium]